MDSIVCKQSTVNDKNFRRPFGGFLVKYSSVLCRTSSSDFNCVLETTELSDSIQQTREGLDMGDQSLRPLHPMYLSSTEHTHNEELIRTAGIAVNDNGK